MTKLFKERYLGREPEVSKDAPSLAKMDGYLHLPSNSRLPAGAKAPIVMTEFGQGAVFLDRDGVLVEDVHFLSHASQLRLLSGVAAGLRALQDRYFLIVITNQSGIARGFFTEEDLLAIHTELAGLLAAEGVAVDALYYCPHLPESVIPGYGVVCDCRKPGPGMFLRAASDWNLDLPSSFMVGDMPRDAEAALAAGVTPVLAGDNVQEFGSPVDRAASLLKIVLVLEHQRNCIVTLYNFVKKEV